MNSIIATRIYNLVSNDPAKIAVLGLLADGRWHTRFEVESVAKDYRPTIGLVGICVILKKLQDADSELLEIYENSSGSFYRLNPQRTSIIKKIMSYHQSNSKNPQMSSSSAEFKKFKERLRQTRKTEQEFDTDLNTFL